MDVPAHSPERQKHLLVSQKVLSKKQKAAPQMVAGMRHFKFTRSQPKRKPTRRQQFQEATTESSSSTILFDDTVKNITSLYPQLTVEVGVHDHKKWGIIQGGLEMEPNSQTPLHKSRAVICSDSDSLVTFKFEVLFIPQVCGCLPEDIERFHELLQTLLPGSGYFLCQGLPSEVTSLMTCNTKVTRRWGLPFNRVDHEECPLWLKVASSSTSSLGTLQRCEKCTKLMYYVRRADKRKKSVTPEQKAKRLLPSSNYPLKYLSPANLQTRLRNISHEKKTRRRKLDRLTGCDNQ